MTPIKELSPSKRGRIIQEVSHGTPYRQIAREFDISPGTITKTVRRHHDHHTRESLPRSGRPKKLSSRKSRYIRREAVQNRREPLKEIANHHNVSPATIRRDLHEHNYHRRVARKRPRLSAIALKKRKQWYIDNHGRDWKNVIFTDESAVVCGEHPQHLYVTRRPGEENLPENLQTTFHSDRFTIMVWGAIAYDHKFPLVRLQLAPSTSDGKVRTKAEGLNGERYVSMILNGPLTDAVRKLEDDLSSPVFVVEDNAPSHSSKVAKVARQQLQIRSIVHPSCSPDLNPIEPIWMMLKSRIANIQPMAKTRDELWSHIQTAWDDIPIEHINGEINKMTERERQLKAGKYQITQF